jgi:cytochrome c553
MNKMTLLVAMGVAMLGAGCSNLQRSRNLDDPRVSGETLAQQVCSICHGVDGNSVSPEFPKLAGQQKQYIINQLTNFRSKHRGDPPGPEYMWGIARSLTDQQIDQIADYFSKQTSKPNVAVAPARFAAGKKIFENGLSTRGVPPCQACHGPEAQGNGQFPRLANQHEHYLILQLNVFQSTNFRPGTPMKEITHALTPEEMYDVAGYLEAFNSEGATK